MSQRTGLIWLGIILFFGLTLYALSSILLPFVVGLLIAYFLDPVVDRLEEWSLARGLATFIVLFIFFMIGISILLILVPVLYAQLMDLLANLPVILHKAREMLDSELSSLTVHLPNGKVEEVKDAVSAYGNELVKMAPKVLGGVWKSSLAVVNLLSLIFITPVVAFYMLRDWDRMVAKINDLLPREMAPTIREQMQEIDRTVAGFIRGQTNVCLILGVYYAIALTIVGLDYGLLIGILAGFLAFLPYVGTLFGTLTAVLVAYFQFGDPTMVGIVCAIFVFAQIVEGNFITPKLVGDSIGLHPVWLIFGMLAGGVLFGVVGVLLAVPVTGIVGVLARFAVEQYRTSSLYGHGENASSKTLNIPTEPAG